jgi:cell division transport system permease protein
MKLAVRPVQWVKRLFGIGETALLPADRRQARPLMVVVAIMCALGCLAGLIARAGFRAADTWTSDLRSAMTVLVEAPRTEQDVTRAAAIIRAVPGVTGAIPMSRERAKQLLRNYGSDIGPLIDELPVPRLIEVGIDPQQTGLQQAIDGRLEAAGFTAEVDDHSRYSGEILRTSGVLRGFALVALLALLGAAGASIAFAARAALETRREAVEILHLVGAQDAFVAAEVQRRFLRLGFVAGVVGAGSAGVLVLLALLVLSSGATGLTAGGALFHWSDVWVLLVAPFVTALASAAAAWVAARETLRELV